MLCDLGLPADASTLQLCPSCGCNLHSLQLLVMLEPLCSHVSIEQRHCSACAAAGTGLLCLKHGPDP